jgi:hypothetical protein
MPSPWRSASPTATPVCRDKPQVVYVATRAHLLGDARRGARDVRLPEGASRLVVPSDPAGLRWSRTRAHLVGLSYPSGVCRGSTSDCAVFKVGRHCFGGGCCRAGGFIGLFPPTRFRGQPLGARSDSIRSCIQRLGGHLSRFVRVTNWARIYRSDRLSGWRLVLGAGFPSVHWGRWRRRLRGRIWLCRTPRQPLVRSELQLVSRP